MYPHRCQLLTPYGDTATLFTSDQLCMRSKRDTKNPVIWLVDSYNFTIYLPSRLTKYGGRETSFRNRENTDFLKSRSGNRDRCFKSGKSRLVCLFTFFYFYFNYRVYLFLSWILNFFEKLNIYKKRKNY